MNGKIEVCIGDKPCGDYKRLKMLTHLSEIIDLHCEDEVQIKPYMYTKSGNRVVEHCYIRNIDIVNTILLMRKVNVDLSNFHSLGISSLWDLPRNEYPNENHNIRLSMTVYYKDCQHTNISVADGHFCEGDQILANKIIEFVNSNIKEGKSWTVKN